MGLGVIAASVIGAGVASIYAIIKGRKSKKDEMQSSNDDFKPTMASEGTSVPYILGRCRVPGNIIWYGNLESEELGGGGGFGGKGAGGETESAQTGFKYYADCWQAISMGKCSLIETYVNDEKLAINAAAYDWNDGTQSTYPSGIEHANKIKGVVHIYIHRMLLGENTKQFPTIHFVVDRILNTPISYQNMASGSNPAAAIYDLLVNQAGADQFDVDTVSFNAAATYWNTKGYGLNLVFDEQKNVYEIIDEILQYVDGVFYINSDNHYALKALNPAETYARTITQNDLKDFSFNRKTWSQVPNAFKATYIDDASDYTERGLVTNNPAAYRLIGKKIVQTIDMKAFRKKATVSARLWELMKRESYPASECEFITNLKYASMLPGEIIRITHDDYDLAGADFRISEIEVNSVDKNEVKINAEQCVESLHDDNFVEAGGTYWANPDTTLVAPDYYDAFEFPYTEKFKNEPAFLFLIERKKYFENGFAVEVSQEVSANYIRLGNLTTFSQYVKLDSAYSSNTFSIDDETGILISIPSNELDVSLESYSRPNLFVIPRVLIVDSEIMTFQSVTPLGGEQYRLTGIVRGAFGTEKETHAINSFGWITFLTNNLLSLYFDDFYSKLLFQNNPDEIAASSVSAFFSTTEGKAKKPRNPGRIVAERTGSNIYVQIFPSSPGIPGAGNSSPDSLTDREPPFDFLGDFEVSYGSTTEIKSMDGFTVTSATSINITIKSRLNGFKSSGKTITVGASDGKYYS